MKKYLRLFAFALFGLFVSPAPMLAGTDDTEREGGILGTGIIGTITNLGSIFVNGQHIIFEPEMPVADGVSVSQAIELRPGHTVAIIAYPDGETWQAAHIRQILPLVGPLQLSDDGKLGVMGTLIVTDGTAFTAMPGDWVAVSGLWQNSQVIATRIDRVSAEVGAQIEGTALDFKVDTTLSIGGTEILGLLPQHIQDGDVIRAFGFAEVSALQVTRLETGVFAREPGIVLAEGYMSLPDPSGYYTVLGSNFVSYTDNPEMIDPVVPFFACGHGGKIAAAIRVSVAPPNFLAFMSDCLGLGITETQDNSD